MRNYFNLIHTNFLISTMDTMSHFLLVLLLFCSAYKCQIPCSTASQETSVIDLCSSGTINMDPVYHNILLKVTSMSICKCMLLVLNSNNNAITVLFTKYQHLQSSQPGELNCGVGLRFTKQRQQFRNIQCFFNSNGFASRLEKNNLISISSFRIDGILNPGKGYCVEISTDISVTNNQTLKLECDNGLSTTATITNLKFSTSTPQLVTDSMSSQILYISMGVTTGTVVVIAVIIMSLMIMRRHRTKAESAVNPNAIPAYDDLVSLPNGNSDNYTALHQDSPITYEGCSTNNIRHMHSTSSRHNNLNSKKACVNNPKKIPDPISTDSISSKKNIQYVNTTFTLSEDINRRQYTNDVVHTYFEICDTPDSN